MGFITLLFMHNAVAAIKTEPMTYSTKDASMEGFLAYDDTLKKPLPGILIVHDWMGLGSFTESKAKELAKDGYVAFAVDLFGKNVHPKNHEEAGQLAKKYLDNRPLLREHIRAAYDKFITLKEVNPKKIVIIGYCLGGTTALELGRSGVPLVGIVSFHGILSNPSPNDSKNIKARVLAFQGAEDPHVPPSEVASFKEEMKNAGIDIELITYPGVVHGFTNPQVGNDKSSGTAYSEYADKNSWRKFKTFLKQVFK